MEKISYTAENVTIVGNYWKGTNGKAAILLHMMPATKESFTPFAEKLHEKGWSVLAIDLRGHGESTKKIHGELSTPMNYQEFSDEEHQSSMHDVEGARDWLEAQGIATENIVIGGASIGANLAINYMAKDPA